MKVPIVITTAPITVDRATAASMLSMSLSGVATLLALVLYFLIAQRRGRRNRRLAAGGAV